jgi:flagellar motor switch protein FliN/FliY
MSEEDSVDMNTFDAEKEMAEALAQEAPTENNRPAPQLNGPQDQSLDRILDIPLMLSAQLGNTRMLIKDLLQLGPGSIVELDKLAGEPLEVLVNERLVARGEVVMVNEKFGIRLTDVISPTERVNKLR